MSDPAEPPEARSPGTYEPGVQTTLANERTYLAWLRTSLGLVAAGIAVVRLLPPFGFPGARQITGLVLVAVGVYVAATAHRRWRKIEEAVRLGRPIPPPTVAWVMAVTIAIVGTVIIVLLIWQP